jgi:hypothetical protein
MLAPVFAALLLLLPSGQAPPPSAPNPPQRAPLLPARSFSRLFTLQDAPPTGDGKNTIVLEDGRIGARKKVVCGMTLIIVDGSIDPKMAIAPRSGGDPDPGMRRVPKPMCGDRDR